MDLFELPEDIIELILEFLPIHECCQFALVSRFAKRISSSSSLWHAIVIREGLSKTGLPHEISKQDILRLLRTFRWTDVHCNQIKVSEDRLVASTDNDCWNGCMAGPVVREGVRVWGVEIASSASTYATYYLGIVDDTCPPAPEDMGGDNCLGDWYGKGCAVEVGYHASVDTSQSPEPNDLLNLSPPDYFTLSIHWACRLVLTSERRSFEMWSSVGAYMIWANLPSGVGFVPGCCLSGDEQFIRFREDVYSTEHISRIVPDFVPYRAPFVTKSKEVGGKRFVVIDKKHELDRFPLGTLVDTETKRPYLKVTSSSEWQ